MTATTWDSVFKSAGVTLSGGSLTATITSGTSQVGASRTVSGPVYFEVTIGASLTGSMSVGLVNGQYNMAGGTLLGADLNGIGYQNGGAVKINAATISTIMTFTAGDRIGVAYNPQTALIWFRKNNGNWNNDVIGNQNPVGNVGGISLATMTAGRLFPALGATTVTPNQAGTAAFTTFTDTAPTGYVTIDTIQSSATNADKAKTGNGQVTSANNQPVTTHVQVCEFNASALGWYGHMNGPTTVSPNVPVPLASVLHDGVVGTAYSETISAAGGVSPYTFALASGALPTGTSLSAGVISGTPSAPGTYGFNIRATDAVGATGTTSFSITITAPSAGGASNYGYVS